MGGLRRLKKNCEQCEKLANPDNYPKGARVRIVEAFDCENCEVMEYQPIEENQNIVDLYDALPQNYEGSSGLRQVSATDIRFILELFEVSKDLWYDYYQKITYFHGELVQASLRAREKKRKMDEMTRKWKAGLKSSRAH